MNEAQGIGPLLAGLGSTSDDVAAALQAANIRGVRNTVRFLNPIVRYAQAWLRNDDFSLDMITAGVLTVTARHEDKLEIPLPNAVLEFLTRFDNGEFPNLELPPP